MKPEMTLELAPRFPTPEEMQNYPPKVRLVYVAVYMFLIINHLKGVEPYGRPILRHHVNRLRSIPLPEIIEVAGLSDAEEESYPAHPPK